MSDVDIEQRETFPPPPNTISGAVVPTEQDQVVTATGAPALTVAEPGPSASSVVDSVMVPVQVDLAARTLGFKAIGFDPNQLKAPSNIWLSWPILPRHGFCVVVAHPRCDVSAVRDLVASHLARGLVLDGIDLKQVTPLWCTFTDYLSPVDASELFARVTPGAGATMPVAYQLATSTFPRVSILDRSTEIRLLDAVKRKPTDIPTPGTILMSIEAERLTGTAVEELSAQVRRLGRLKMTVVVLIRQTAEADFHPRQDFADSVLYLRPYADDKFERAFVMSVRHCRHFGGQAIPPQVLKFRRNANGRCQWIAEPYIADSEDLRAMHAMHSSGATYREIGLAFNVAASTVMRQLKSLKKDLG